MLFRSKARAHDLKPVVMIGGDGLTPAVIKEAKLAIGHHGLIKVRVFGDDRQTRIAMYAELCDELGAAPVQHIGKLLVLYKPKDVVEETFSKSSRQAPRAPSKSGTRANSERSNRRTASDAAPFARAAAFKASAPKIGRAHV